MSEENRKRIDDKIAEIRKYLVELDEIKVDDLELYKQDFRTRGLYERYFEKIISAIIDLAFIFIKKRKVNMPEDEEHLFDTLYKEGIISEELMNKLKDAKGTRNIIAHEYGNIDDELVFHSVNEELNSDVEEFMGIVVKLIETIGENE